MRTPRLPVVDWTDAPSRFKWTRLFRRKTKSGFWACAITFQTQYTLRPSKARCIIVQHHNWQHYQYRDRERIASCICFSVIGSVHIMSLFKCTVILRALSSINTLEKCPKNVPILSWVFLFYGKGELCGKWKAVPLEARKGPESSRKLRFPDFVTTAQDGGRVVSLTHRPPLPQGNASGTHFC